jgi:hypothetical protein
MIPVPPFADVAEARLFLRQLSAHLAALDRDRVTLPTFILLSPLEGVHNSIRRAHPDRPDLAPVHLPASVLRIALLSRFPVPWTPQGLHAALAAGDDWARAAPSTATEFSEGPDPIITATRSAAGLWTVTHTERGSTHVTHDGLDDAAYVQKLLDDARGHPYPYGWKSDDLEGLDEVMRSGGEARERWESGHGRLPYLTNWIDQRDDVLSGRDPES